jgi:hypothetical protein
MESQKSTLSQDKSKIMLICDEKIIPSDSFNTLNQEGVGQLCNLGV